MGNKHSQAKKKFWASKTPQQRKQMMSIRATKGWKSKTLEERKAHSLVMEKARLKLD